MKIKNLILYFMLISCSQKEVAMEKTILSPETIQVILKEIHLAEASFEINKKMDLKNAKNILASQYISIYKKHKINNEEFEKSMLFYSKKPDEIEKIYSNILNEISNEEGYYFQK
jgi:hypothetical protein